MNDIAKLAAEVTRQYNAQRFAIAEAARVLQDHERTRRSILEAAIKPMLDHQRMLKTLTFPLLAEMKAIEAQRKALTHSLASILAFADSGPWKHFSAVLSDIRQIQSQVSQIGSLYASLRLDLQATAILPSVAATEHIQRTLKLSHLWEQASKSVAPLASSIACTQRQVVTQDEDIVRYPAVFALDTLQEDEQDELAVFPTLNLYHIQRSELVTIARKSPDALEDDQTIDSLPSFEYTRTARTICGLVVLINQQRAARGEQDIFKPTNQLIRALVGLPNLIAVSRDLFAQFIDYMFFLVYESAGGNSLRFLSLVDDSAASPVWAIKHFRNLDLRHDVEHGKPREIEKKQKDLGEDYLCLIGVPMPRTRRDFRNAQLALVKQVEEMLKKISDVIQALPPPETGKP